MLFRSFVKFLLVTFTVTPKVALIISGISVGTDQIIHETFRPRQRSYFLLYLHNEAVVADSPFNVTLLFKWLRNMGTI